MFNKKNKKTKAKPIDTCGASEILEVKKHMSNEINSEEVFNASKEELLIMLYDGALKFCNQAFIAFEDKEYDKADELIVKVQNIVAEFRKSLDKQYDVANNLDNIYEYMHERLAVASQEKDPDALIEVRNHIRTLRDTWKKAAETSA
jgi:flagellar protein FliS